jgi:hypothetical protein
LACSQPPKRARRALREEDKAPSWSEEGCLSMG